MSSSYTGLFLLEVVLKRLELVTPGWVERLKIACGNQKGNLLLKTCFQRRNFGLAEGESSPAGPSN